MKYALPNMESTNFDKISTDEKRYCGALLEKYKTPPRFEETLNPLLEYWDADKDLEWAKTYKNYCAKLEDYKDFLTEEIKKDPYVFIEYLVPSIFKFCQYYRVYCDYRLVVSLAQYAINGCGTISVSTRSNYYYNALVDKNHAENYSFSYPFSAIRGIPFSEIIVPKWSHMNTGQNKMTNVLFDFTAKNQPVPINASPVYKISMELAQYNYDTYTEISKDINTMLYCVENLTVYDPVKNTDLGDREFHDYFNNVKMPGSRLKKKFIDHEYTGDEIDLETEQIVSILYSVRLKSGTRCATRKFTTVKGKPSFKSAEYNHNLFEKYVSKLDKDQLRELCDYFHVDWYSTTPKETLINYITEVFNCVEPPTVLSALDDLKEGQKRILNELYDIISAITKNCSTTNDIWCAVNEHFSKRQVASKYTYETNNQKLFAERLSFNLRSILMSYILLSSGKLKGSKTLSVTLIGESLNLIGFSWLSKLFDGYKDKQRRVNAAQISDQMSLNEIEELSARVAHKLASRYKEQLLYVHTDKCAYLGEHAVYRMVKYMDKHFNAHEELEDQLIRSVYRVSLTGKIYNEPINNENWNADGLFSRVGMITEDGKKYVHKKRMDQKYGFILVDEKEVEQHSQMTLCKNL